MSRGFEVVPGVVPVVPGTTRTGEVVARFLGLVRVTGDEEAAAGVMAPVVRCHQVVAEEPVTIERTPADYAAHVQEMLAAAGRFRYVVEELLVDGDRCYVRWQQHGHDLLRDDGSRGSGRPVREVGSAVYRVEDGRIAEYWIQLDRLGLQRQLDDNSYVREHTLDKGS